jgi:hypothetical protein
MTTAYPTETAREVSLRRPDLAANDAIAAVLTADPTLTADEVIALLDEAAADHDADETA